MIYDGDACSCAWQARASHFSEYPELIFQALCTGLGGARSIKGIVVSGFRKFSFADPSQWLSCTCAESAHHCASSGASFSPV